MPRPFGLSAASFKPDLGKDVLAGFVNGVISVPNGLATGSLAGVSPVAGLYGAMIGPTAGGAVASTHLMMIATTSASAIAAGQAVAAYPAEQRIPALGLLVLMTGALLALFGVLKVGRLVRYVPFSVMQGFLFGVALVLVLNQSAPLVGYEPEGGNSLTTFVDLILNVGSWNPQAVTVGVLALVLVTVLNRTRIATWSNVIALVVPTALALGLGWSRLQQVGDVSRIPRGLPALMLPDLSLFGLDLLLGALALAGVIAVQGVGVSQSVTNPDDSRISSSHDLVAQGAGNLASGLLGGLPVGASVGQTALNRSLGARTRWSAILCGVWMLAFILLLAPIIELIPMAVLGALMVYAGIGALNFAITSSIGRTGWIPFLGFAVTLLVTITVSVPTAVLTGVAMSILLHMIQAGSDVTVRVMETDEQGRVAERDVPDRLPDERVTVLSVYGALFFAGAKELEANLPTVRGSTRPVVVLRLRGQQHVGATLVDVLHGYADDLADVGGRLVLTGVEPGVVKQLERAGRLDTERIVDIVETREYLGESTAAGIRRGREWLDGHTDVDRDMTDLLDDTPRMLTVRTPRSPDLVRGPSDEDAERRQAEEFAGSDETGLVDDEPRHRD